MDIVTDFGADFTGASDSSAALNAARLAVQARGGKLHIPAGTYLVSDPSALAFTSGDIILEGEGQSIIKAANGANLGQILAAGGTNSFVAKNIVIDGNRANGGTSPTTSYGVIFGSSRCKLKESEVRNCNRIGVFIGSSSATPYDLDFDDVYVHGNGGLVAGGIGVGIYGGGTFPVNGLRIRNSRFEDNHNTVTGPGDSSALNIQASNVQIIGNRFLNNYNVNGGMVALTDNSAGTTKLNFVIADNIIGQTGSFGGDLTCGIEVMARSGVVRGNVINGVSSDGIRFEAGAGDANISDNVIYCGVAGINLINSGGAGMYRTVVRGNSILQGSVGIGIQTPSGAVTVEENFIDNSIATPISGAANCTLLRNNSGYGYGYLSYSMPSIPAGASASATVTVPGAILTDLASAAYSRDLAGLIMTAWVSAANTVTVKFYNPTSSAIAIASDVIRAWIEQRYL